MSGEKLTRLVVVPLTEGERAVLDATAAALGKPASEVARRAIALYCVLRVEGDDAPEQRREKGGES